MIDAAKIKAINNIIKAYFKANKKTTIIPVKELMPDFIKAGIFIKDIKNGKPIRDILRELDKTNQRELIPFMHSQERDNNIYWYFIPSKKHTPTELYKFENNQSKKELANIARAASDESYIIDLCDTILEQKAERQKRFDFLLGDLHSDGFTRTKLPVDAYYHTINIVIEYREADKEDLPNKNETKTISGVSRAAQRRIYDRRRATELPKHGIKVIEIPFSSFNCDSENKIIRNETEDLKTIAELISNAKKIDDNLD